MNVKVENMTSRNSGRPIANQFIVRVNNRQYFQSYHTVIAMIDEHGHVFLDREKWDCSVTTGKYRNQFLEDSGIAETRKKIKSGEYQLTGTLNLA